jgi:branched-chain amino acid transport system ATP-binding protein
MLSVEGLAVSYAGVAALRGVTLAVGDGEFVTVLGANGAGKSTLLRATSGLLRPDRGTITVGGVAIQGLAPHSVARIGVAHVPEGRQVFADQTVLENLQLGGYLWRRDRAAFDAALGDVLTLFPRLAERRAQLAGTLSGGEQQMVAIGRALMSRPKLLMLDEPSLGLAPRVVHEVFDLLGRLHRERGVSILLVEQAAALALSFAERGYVLENGVVALSGPAKELAADWRVQEVYLGAAARA